MIDYLAVLAVVFSLIILVVVLSAYPLGLLILLILILLRLILKKNILGFSLKDLIISFLIFLVLTLSNIFVLWKADEHFGFKYPEICDACVLAPDSKQCLAYLENSNVVGCNDPVEKLEACGGDTELCVAQYEKEAGIRKEGEVDHFDFGARIEDFVFYLSLTVHLIALVIAPVYFVVGLSKKVKFSRLALAGWVFAASISFLCILLYELSIHIPPSDPAM